MQPATLEDFGRLFERFAPDSGRVVEIGAPCNPAQSLLSYFTSRGDSYECTGLDLTAGESRWSSPRGSAEA